MSLPSHLSPRDTGTRSLLLVSAALAALGATTAGAAPVITPNAPLTGFGRVSAHGDVVAVTQERSASTVSLLVGRGGAVPTPVTGVGTIPRWALPHVGTDRRGRSVVVYPRCPGTAVQRCDLWAYDVRRQRAAPLTGVNSTLIGEIEGAMVGGAVAYARWTAKGKLNPLRVDQTTTLMYKPATGTARTVTTRGGQQIALAGNQIAQVRNADLTDGECGQPRVELLTTAGSRRTVRVYHCGLDGHMPLGLAFVRDRLLWAMHGSDQGHYAQHVLATRKTFYEDVSTEFLYWYAPVRTTSGLIVRQDFSATGDNWTLDTISGLTYPRGR